MSDFRILSDLLKKTGGTMSGDLIFASGANILALVSGVNSIGTQSNPFKAIYADFIISSGAAGQFVDISGDTMTGPLYLPVLSGTVISGGSIFDNGNRVITSINGSGGAIVSINTDGIPEGIINLYYTDNRVRAVISGSSPISVVDAFITIFSGSAIQDGYISSHDWSRFNAIAVASGNYVLKAGDTMSGALNAPIVSGTIISGGSIFDNGNRVVTSVNGTNGPVVSLDTDEIPEGALNLYYTDARVRTVISGTVPVVSGVFPIIANSGVISIASGSASSNGYISSGDWNTFNNKQPSGNYLISGVSTSVIPEGTNLYYTDARVHAVISGTIPAVSGISPIVVTSGIVSIDQATSTQDGFLTKTDWGTFNGKQNDLGYVPLNQDGDTVHGTLTFFNGANLENASSGVNSLGTSLAPYGYAYIDNIISRTIQLGHVKEVRKEPTLGQFSSIAAAVASISGASVNNPFIVYVHPGVYSEPTIDIPPYVSIVGQDQTTCVVQPIGNNTLFNISTNGMMSFLSVKNVPSGYYGAYIVNPGDYITLHKVSFVDCDTAMYVEANDGNPDNQLYLEYVDATQNGSTRRAFEFLSVLGTPIDVSCENFYVYGEEGLGNPPIGVVASGSGLTLSFRAAALNGTDGDGVGLQIEDSANVKLPVLGISNWASGIYVPENNGNPHLEIFSTAFSNNTVWNLDLQASGLSGFSNTYSPYSLNNINPNNSFFFVNKDQKVITVAKKGGDFSTIYDAVNAISGLTSAQDIYVIQVNPGIYDEPAIVVPPYTTILGKDTEAVIIRPQGDYDLLTLSNNSNLYFLQLFGNGNSLTSSAIVGDNLGSYSVLHKVYVNDFNKGMTFTNSVSGVGSYVYLEYSSIQAQNYGIPTYALSVASDHGGDSVLTVDAQNFTVYTYIDDPINSIIVQGQDCTLLTKVIDLEGYSVSGNAINIYNNANLEMSSATIKNYGRGLYNQNTGGPATIRVNSLDIKGCNEDVSINQISTTASIQGNFNKSNSTIDSPFVTILNNDSFDNSAVIMGDLFLGKNFSGLTYMSPLLANSPSVGLISGGVITQTAGIEIQVTQGFGYVDTDQNDWTKTKYISWPTQTKLIGTSGTAVDEYIFINSNGILSSTPTQIFGNVDKILLGRVVTRATGHVDYIEALPTSSAHMGNKYSELFKVAFGPIVSDGLVVAAIPSGLTVSISDGEYFFGEHKISPTSIYPFHADFYHVSGNWFASFNISGTISNTQYDSPVTSGLTNLTAGYYTKHSLWLDGLNKFPYMVYGQAEYSGLSACEFGPAPIPSPTFKDAVVHIADIIVQQGSGSIISVLDTRPIPSFKQSLAQTGGTGGTNNHSALINLDKDDHKQYLLADGSRSLNGDLNLGGNNIVNVNQVGGIIPSGHASRHLPNGADPLATSTPIDISLGGGNEVGIQNYLARSDHKHNIQQASGTQSGFLSSADWNTFNNKQPSGNYLVSGVTTTVISEGTNLYYLDSRVNNNANVINISGIATLASGNATTALQQIAVVSGVAYTAIQNIVSSGNGSSLVDGKSGTTQFINSISGVGSVVITGPANGIITISGSATTPSVSSSGTGQAIYNSTIGSTIFLNTVSGLGTVSTSYANGVVNISGAAYSLPSNVVQSASNSGTGFSIYNSQNGNNLVFNTISGIGSTTITYSNGNISISGSSAGESNTASNLGTGFGWFSSKVGVDLRFKSITSGNNINLVNNVGSDIQVGVSNNPSFTSVFANLVSGTTISGGSIYSNGVLLQNYTLPTTINATVLSGTTISGASIFKGGVQVATITDVSNVSGTAASALQSLASSGIATSIYATKIGTTGYLNSISGVGSVIITGPTNGIITISGSATTPSVSSSGTGQAIYNSTVGSTIFLNTVSGLGTVSTSYANGVVNISGAAYNLPTTINATVLSGTTISGGSIFQGGTQVASSISVANNLTANLTSGAINISGSLTPTYTSVYANLVSGTTISGTTGVFNTLTVPQSDYVFAYDSTTQSVVSSGVFQNINFANASQLSGWTHASSGAGFTCANTGLYLVNYNVNVQKTTGVNSMAEVIATFNGVEVAGSQISYTISANNLPIQLSKSLLVNATSGQVLQLQFTAYTTTTQLVSVKNKATTGESASITITKIR